MRERPAVTIYVDGACVGNPGPGGYGAVLLWDGRRHELAGGRRLTTNNRMEVLAATAALAALRCPSRVTVYSDSRYLVDTMMQGWATRANGDLWAELAALCRTHEVEFKRVRGHSGDAENGRCDRLATAAAAEPGLPDDEGYGRRVEREAAQLSLFDPAEST